MEDLEVRLLKTSGLKPKVWLRYIDEIQHLLIFFNHINEMQERIQFIVTLKNYSQLAFRDFIITKNANEGLQTQYIQ